MSEGGLTSGRRMLDEVESKALLRRYGVNATVPRLARSAAEATEAARGFGVPVAMKIVSPDIAHKSAIGGVRLGVVAADAAAAHEAIAAAVRKARPEAKVHGVLVEPMTAKGFELFAGGKHDDQFGPVLIVGQGGVDVERDDRVKALLVPLSKAVAERTARELLDGRVDADALDALSAKLAVQLLALGGDDGVLMREPVVELDVNPLIVTADDVVAVDGLAIVDDGARGPASRPVDVIRRDREARLGGIRSLFEPDAIAVIGASTNPAKLGYRMIAKLREFGFTGQLYPIHPTATSIAEVPAFKSLDDIPGPVDRALIAVPAREVPNVLARCAAKGVRVAQVLTAGFSEWANAVDQDDPKRLEQALVDALAGTSLRMVGPNCIGTFSAKTRMPIVNPRYSLTEPGGITFFSQSGTFACDVARRAHAYGIPVGRVLSCGNCLDLDPVDFLLANEADPDATLTGFYVESIRDPSAFFRVAAQATKPIVLLKGGKTSQGVAAASSHTAALASDTRLWDAGIAHSGIVEVRDIEEMMDVLLAFSTMGITETAARAPGNRVAIFGSGGGVSVISADVSSREGLVIADLGDAVVAGVDRFGVPGTSVENPIDIPVWGLLDGDRYIFGDVIDLLKADPDIDLIVAYLEPGSVLDFAETEKQGLAQLDAQCASIAACRRDGPPVVVSLRTSGAAALDDFVRRQRIALGAKGLAAYPSTSRAIRAQAALWRLAQRWGRAA